jgi:Putative Ig domain
MRQMLFRNRFVAVLIRAALALYITCSATQLYAQDKTAIPDQQAGSTAPFNYTFAIDGGQAPFKWVKTSGTLPDGLVLNSEGSITGTLRNAKAASYEFVVTVTDHSDPPQSVSETFVLKINSAPLRILGGNLQTAKMTIKGGTLQDQPSQPPVQIEAPLQPPMERQQEPVQRQSDSSQPASADPAAVPPADPAKRRSPAPAASKKPLKLEPNIVSTSDGSKGVTVKLSGPPAGTSFWINCSTPIANTTDNSKFPFAIYNGGTKDYSIGLSSDLVKSAGSIPITAGTDDCSDPDPSFFVVLTVSGFKNMAPLGEALVGVDVTGASSASPQAVLLALGVVDIPLRGVDRKISDSKFGSMWLSGQLGLKGMAQPGTLSSAASAGYYASAANATPDKIVQSMDVSMHLGLQLHTWTIPIGTFDINLPNTTAENHPTTTATLSFIAGGGAITPLSISQSSPQVFEATPLILQNETPVAPFTSFAPSCSANPAAAPTCYVIFTPSDRTHFYRYYDGGFRLKLYAKDFPDSELRFPAILDLTVGQNEYVTGGNAHGPVLHIGGSVPIPREDSFFLFGNFDLGLSRGSGGGPQLQLIPAPVTAGLTPTSPSVYTILTTQPNRDRYSIGFGVDVFHFLQSKSEKNSTAKGGS